MRPDTVSSAAATPPGADRRLHQRELAEHAPRLGDAVLRARSLGSASSRRSQPPTLSSAPGVRGLQLAQPRDRTFAGGSRTTIIVCDTAACATAAIAAPMTPWRARLRHEHVRGILGAERCRPRPRIGRLPASTTATSRDVRARAARRLAVRRRPRVAKRRAASPTTAAASTRLCVVSRPIASGSSSAIARAALDVGERSPFDAHVGERRDLRRPQRRHLLRRQQLDLVGLHLLGEAHRLRRRRRRRAACTRTA